MNARWTWIVMVGLASFLVGVDCFSRAEDLSVGPVSETPSGTALVAADDILALIELVLEKHFDPPTRQAMVHSATKGLYHFGTRAPADLAFRISNAPDVETLRKLLITACADVQTHAEREQGSLVEFAGDAILQSLPGGGDIDTVKSHRVSEQLAANRYVGLGIALGQDDQKVAKIHDVLPGGPCDVKGVPVGSRILAIDEWKTEGQPLTEVVDRIRGPEGTTVTLDLDGPEGQGRRSVALIRGVVPMKSIDVNSEEGILVIKFRRLSASTPHELRKLAAAQGEELRGVVLDLRTAESGDAHHAAMVADLFLSEGLIGWIVEGGKSRPVNSLPEELFAGLPMAIVVDRTTDGPLEWAAASLLERQRAAVFGGATPGLAIGESAHPLPSGEYVVRFATSILETPAHARMLGTVENRALPRAAVAGAALPGQRAAIDGRIIPPNSGVKLPATFAALPRRGRGAFPKGAPVPVAPQAGPQGTASPVDEPSAMAVANPVAEAIDYVNSFRRSDSPPTTP